MLWQGWENLQGQAQASGRGDENALVTSRRLLRSAASSPRRTPGWGRRESVVRPKGPERETEGETEGETERETEGETVGRADGRWPAWP